MKIGQVGSAGVASTRPLYERRGVCRYRTHPSATASMRHPWPTNPFAEHAKSGVHPDEAIDALRSHDTARTCDSERANGGCHRPHRRPRSPNYGDAPGCQRNDRCLTQGLCGSAALASPHPKPAARRCSPQAGRREPGTAQLHRQYEKYSEPRLNVRAAYGLSVHGLGKRIARRR